MKYDYSPMVQTTLRMVKRFGMSATLIQTGSASGDPWAPEYGPGTEATVQILLTDFTAQERQGTQISVHDRKVIMAADGPRPTTGDKIRIGTDTYDVISLPSVTEPAGVPVVYELQVRQ